MSSVVVAFYKDTFTVILNFLEVLCLQLIYFGPRINAFLEQFIEQWNFQQTIHRYHLNHQSIY